MTASDIAREDEVKSGTEMAILFADIGGSTNLYQRAGDTQAHQLIVNSLNAMRQAVEAAGGVLLRTVGDAVLARFASCENASNAAKQVQELHSTSSLSVRVGFHWGSAIADDGDVYGNAVNIAARVAGLANTGEIVVTADVVERLASATAQSAQLLDELSVKGIDQPLRIFRLPWQAQPADGATMIFTDLAGRGRKSVKVELHLECGGTTLLLNADSEKCTIGRGDDNSLQAGHNAASRMHATIECKQGVYVLEDVSTNGTYVVKKGQPPVYVHRDTLTLDGAGVIATGFLPDEDSVDTISFVSQLAMNQ